MAKRPNDGFPQDTFRSKAMTHSEASLWLRRFYYALEHHQEALLMRFKKDMHDERGKDDTQPVTRPKFGIPGNICGLHEWLGWEKDKPVAWKITINPSRRKYGGEIKTFIHELIHHVERKWNEDKVKRYEHLIYEALSDRQLWNLMKKIFTLY